MKSTTNCIFHYPQKNCPGAAVAKQLRPGPTRRMVRPIPKDSQASPTDHVYIQPLLIAGIFQHRLSPTNGKSQTSLMEKHAKLYIWNIQISAAFWGGFHFLEILLRNAIHQKLSEYSQSEAWWETDLPLHQSDRDYMYEAVAKLNNQKKPTTPERVITQLHFGLWVGLFARAYHASLWLGNLEEIFPNFEGSRQEIHIALESLRKLRNRIAHHEAIYRRDLSFDFESLCSIIGYLDLDTANLVKSLSKVKEVLAAKEAVLNGTAELSF